MSAYFSAHLARVTVPMVAPSVNHYVKHTRAGRHYKTVAAKAWEDAFAAAAAGAVMVRGKAYEVEYALYLGKGDRLDVDNAAKVIVDAAVRVGIIKTDAAVRRLIATKHRDPSNPRTEVMVREFLG